MAQNYYQPIFHNNIYSVNTLQTKKENIIKFYKQFVTVREEEMEFHKQLQTRNIC